MTESGESVDATTTVTVTSGDAAQTAVKAKYKMGRILGQGAFGKVKLATAEDGTMWAVKIVNRKSLSASDAESLKLEMQILCKVNHKNVVLTKEIFDSHDSVYIVMECMSGGELFDRIVEKEFYSEREARTAFWDCCRAVEYCHSRGVVHRDLKPENILYASTDADATLKLADFGLADILTPETMLMATCGTPTYVAPEIIALTTSDGKNGGYDSKVDMWSLGVILYILICGFPPFNAEDDRQLFKLVKHAHYEFVEPYWDDASDDVMDLISKLLVVDPAKRLSAEEALKHPWLSSDFPHKDIHLASGIKNLKSYNARRRLKGAVRALTAARKLKLLSGKEGTLSKASAN